MRKLKEWFINKFLPAWAKETVLEELKKERREKEKLQQENARLEMYIRGLEAGIRGQRRVVIYSGSDRRAEI